MAAKFDLNDDGVVVVIGSGAGGGVLSNELAQKALRLFASKRAEGIYRRIIKMMSGAVLARSAG